MFFGWHHDMRLGEWLDVMFFCVSMAGDLKWSTRGHLPPAFEDVFPSENGGFSNVMLVL